LRAEFPTPTLLLIVPRFSTRPEDWVAAAPSAHAIRAASSPSSLPAAAAAPSTPQVAVMCQPRR